MKLFRARSLRHDVVHQMKGGTLSTSLSPNPNPEDPVAVANDFIRRGPRPDPDLIVHVAEFL